jgi:hypothetical protein
MFGGPFVINWYTYTVVKTLNYEGFNILTETITQFKECERFAPDIGMKCILAPMGVDVGAHVKGVINDDLKIPLVYMKTRRDSTAEIYFNASHVHELMRKAGISAYTFLRTSHFQDYSFNHSQYLQALESASWMLSLTAGEMFGNFIQEAKLMNVPQLMVKEFGVFPWYTESSGDSITLPVSDDDLVQRIRTFSGKSREYAPRLMATIQLTNKACARRFLLNYIAVRENNTQIEFLTE